jgi:transcriptional regulator with XRE-family HTH domain
MEWSDQAAKIFGRNLRAARLKAGLSQEEVANACGLHRTEISLLERGRRQPRLETLARLADLLGSTLDELRDGIRFEQPSLEEVLAAQGVARARTHELRCEAQREAQRKAQPLRRQREQEALHER